MLYTLSGVLVFSGSCSAMQDLYTRTQDPSRDRQAKLCMHMGTFVWHWKGGTIPMGGDRTKWEIPSERTNAKAKASIKHK